MTSATGLSTMSDVLALLNKIDVKLINTTGQAISFVNATGNIIRTYEPAESSLFKINRCSWLVTEETYQSLQLIIPSIKIPGPTPSLMVAIPKEPYYEEGDNPLTPKKLIGYKWIALHNIDFKQK